MEVFLNKITQGLVELSIESNPEQREALWYYLTQLQKWNKVYNLTTLRSTAEIIANHFLDSLSVLPYLTGKEVLDVGSGAGFPGMVLALFDSTRHYTLLDSCGKKISFLTYLQSHWQLKNVSIVHSRLEALQPTKQFASIICRAFSHLSVFFAQATPYLKTSGCLLAMKGRIPEEELTHIPWEYKVIPLTVPYLTAQRHLVMITPS